ncbi:MAG: cytochrome C oxidase subunit IV family protein [bacterium]
MAGPSHTTIWVWLMGLLAAGLAVAAGPFGRAVAIALIVSVAVVKAVLVARHYMHLKGEPPIIYVVAAAPVLLLLVLLGALVPDLVWSR